MKKIALLTLLGTMAFTLPVSATENEPAYSNPVFDMSTDYPGIYAKPGEKTSFGLDFLNTTGESLDATLEVKEIPENWEGFFKGKSGEISKVHIASANQEAQDLATFSLTIPEDAQEGVYEIVVAANATDGLTDDVILEVNVSQQENGASDFTAEYPQQQAPSGTKFTFKTKLENNKGLSQSYTLAAQAPEGWQVTFTPSGESASVASVDLEAGANKDISVDVIPPVTLTEGEYTIPIDAISANETISTELQITITGQYNVNLSTPDERLSFDAYANDEKAVTLAVTNTGNVDLKDLSLSSSAPADWEVSFDESEIELLAAGETKEITAHVKPAADSMTGDYVTDITVKNDVTTSTAEFRISVKTRTTWGLAAAGIIVVLIGILGFIFKKYGRR